MWSAPTRCSYCNEDGWNKEEQETTFILSIKSTLQHTECNHLEELKNSWWFCSSACITNFFSHERSIDKIKKKALYQAKSSEWQTDRITHEEFMQATQCEHNKFYNRCDICDSNGAEIVIQRNVVASGIIDDDYWVCVNKPKDFNEEKLNLCSMSGSGDWWDKTHSVFKEKTKVGESLITFRLQGKGEPPEVDETILISYLPK